jgi:hypothetical protein
MVCRRPSLVGVSYASMDRVWSRMPGVTMLPAVLDVAAEGSMDDFQIGYVAEDDTWHRVPLVDAWAVRFDAMVPARRFTARRGQRHLSGRWSASDQGIRQPGRFYPRYGVGRTASRERLISGPARPDAFRWDTTTPLQEQRPGADCDRPLAKVCGRKYRICLSVGSCFSVRARPEGGDHGGLAGSGPLPPPPSPVAVGLPSTAKPAALKR